MVSKIHTCIHPKMASRPNLIFMSIKNILDEKPKWPGLEAALSSSQRMYYSKTAFFPIPIIARPSHMFHYNTILYFS